MSLSFPPWGTTSWKRVNNAMSSLASLKCNTHIKESIHEIRQAKKNFEKGGTQAKAQLGYAWVPFRQLSWIWLEGIVFPNESLLLRSTTGGSSVLHNWPYIEKLTWRFKNALGLWMSSSQICVKYKKKKLLSFTNIHNIHIRHKRKSDSSSALRAFRSHWWIYSF